MRNSLNPSINSVLNHLSSGSFNDLGASDSSKQSQNLSLTSDVSANRFISSGNSFEASRSEPFCHQWSQRSEPFSIGDSSNSQDHLFLRRGNVIEGEKLRQKRDTLPRVDLFDNWHSRALLIKYLLRPEISRGAKNERVRYRPTEFKTLNAMYQLNKNIGRTWTKFACGKKKIGATRHKVGRKAVTRFVCGEGLVFFKKTARFKATNEYELENWVLELFRFFEKKGMMHGIIEDFEKWRETFLKRLDKWLLPLLQKGNSLKDILLNKLSTKKPIKGADPNTLKGAGIKPSGYEAFQGSKSNLEFLPCVLGIQKTATELTSRFSIQEGDVNWLINCFSLNDLRGGLKIRDLWQKRGMEAISPIKTFMAAITTYRKNKNGY